MRKAIQVALARTMEHPGRSTYLVALCNDGTMWYLEADHDGLWFPLPAIPQPDIEPANVADLTGPGYHGNERELPPPSEPSPEEREDIMRGLKASKHRTGPDYDLHA